MQQDLILRKTIQHLFKGFLIKYQHGISVFKVHDHYSFQIKQSYWKSLLSLRDPQAPQGPPWCQTKSACGSLGVIPRWYFSLLKHIQKHLLVTFIDRAKFIFCDKHRSNIPQQMDRQMCLSKKLTMKMKLKGKTSKFRS